MTSHVLASSSLLIQNILTKTINICDVGVECKLHQDAYKLLFFFFSSFFFQFKTDKITFELYSSELSINFLVCRCNKTEYYHVMLNV